MTTAAATSLPVSATTLHDHLRRLAAKYGVSLDGDLHLRQAPARGAAEDRTLLPGWCLCGEQGQDLSGANAIALLPWRSERRFIELRNLVRSRTVETVCLWRSRCLAGPDRWGLVQALYRELGLCQWVLGSPLVSIYAARNGNRAANIVARLENGVACGIEIGLTLPAGSPLMDRHEAVARRGIASDQVVDSIVRPSSVYVMAGPSVESYLDTDSELYGLAEDQVAIVREAYAWLRQTEISVSDLAEHQQICRAVAAPQRSSELNQRVDIISERGHS